MTDSYEIFQKILRRNTIEAFHLSLEDKNDIDMMGGRLDDCIKDLGNLGIELHPSVLGRLESFK